MHITLKYMFFIYIIFKCSLSVTTIPNDIFDLTMAFSTQPHKFDILFTSSINEQYTIT